MKKYIVEINDNEYEVTIREKQESERKKTGEDNERNQMKKMQQKENVEEKKEFKQNRDNKEKNIDVGDNQVVEAPMSGKVLSINLEKGDKVKINSVIMTLEAMKMETEIVAPIEGKISDIVVNEGDRCKQGERLALIKKAGDK